MEKGGKKAGRTFVALVKWSLFLYPYFLPSSSFSTRDLGKLLGGENVSRRAIRTTTVRQLLVAHF